MAAFAAGILRRLLAGSDAFEMRIPEEAEPNIRMAGLADRASEVRVRRLVGKTAACEDVKGSSNYGKFQRYPETVAQVSQSCSV